MHIQTARYFIGRRTLILSGVVCVIITGFGWFFWMHGKQIMEEELKERLRTTASIAAHLFDAGDIVAVEKNPTSNRAALRRIVDQLNVIREETNHIRFAYIMRRTEDPMSLAFVADADTFATQTELDQDHDGIVEPDEHASMPGDLFDISEIPVLQGEAFDHPTVDAEFTHDQWGTFISGYAPIFDDDGIAVGVLGIDINANDFLLHSQRLVSPIIGLLMAMLGIIVAGMILWDNERRRNALKKIVDDERSGLLQLALHRIGTPLTIFKWSLETLADCMSNNSCSREDIESHIDQMRKGIVNMDQVIQQLLEVERVEVGSLRNEPRPVIIRDCVQQVVDDIKTEWQYRNQQLVIENSCNLPVIVDPKILGNVIRELLLNAVLYSPRNSPIVVHATQQLHHVSISITDNGCGIKAQDRVRVFGKFVRGENAHLYHPNGSGLGLYIARGVVKHIGGSIWIESTAGNGTTVTFTVPRAPKESSD